jgi:acyl-CoA synthetase
VPTLERLVAAHAADAPDGLAYAGGEHRMTWGEYDACGSALAAVLADAAVVPGDRVAVWMPDGPAVHACYLGVERAGGVVVGIGPRAGRREVEHLLGVTGASLLLHGAEPEPAPAGVPTIVVSETDLPQGRDAPRERARGIDDLWLLNSTSGTTGLPKCVMHDQRRWFAFHELAVDAGGLTSDDVFLSALPAPFGFGLWTAHVTPTVLGVPCVVLPRFDAEACLAAIERERVTVLAAVSTQFIMLLNSAALDRFDLTSLRVLFTGGEMVPERRAAEFEERTGCRVLQFYGSNETGALSRTTIRDTRARRLRTAGAVIPSMQVRLLADDGADVTAAGGPGVAACRGPLCCLGYYGDPDANAALYTSDGWMLTGDRCTIDADGYLTVAGRASDFIIRGGKNVSAAQVEDEVSTHPAVAVAAAIAMPDAVFGERVCAYVELRPDAAPLDLAALQDHLAARGIGKELWPEHLVVLDALPRASGGKVAKGALREDVRRRVPTAER